MWSEQLRPDPQVLGAAAAQLPDALRIRNHARITQTFPLTTFFQENIELLVQRK